MTMTKPIRPEKVIQFGEGGFLRGFVDWMLQILNEQTDFNGSVAVVQPLPQGMCDRLQEQDCVYTHIMRGLHNGAPVVESKRIDVISRTVKPYDDYEAYLRLADDPAFRFVVSNTTEAGIVYEAGDKLSDAPHHTFPAKVAALLYRRYRNGLSGFVFLPCELIDKNGETLKACILRYAADWQLEQGFIDWVEKENVFCNTLVDRIVTGYPKDETFDLGYTDNMLNTSELFHLWVIEGPRSVLAELPFDKTELNVLFTDDLEAYRTRKVRILNGAHTSMIPYAMLRGLETVKDCMEDGEMAAFVRGCVFEEIIPTLDLPREELVAYANDVFERFNNPYIRHFCASISLNSVSKFKVRVLPSLLTYIKRTGEMPARLIKSLYMLIAFYKSGTPTDSADVVTFMREKSIPEILANTAFWDTDLSFLYDEVMKYAD